MNSVSRDLEAEVKALWSLSRDEAAIRTGRTQKNNSPSQKLRLPTGAKGLSLWK